MKIEWSALLIQSESASERCNPDGMECKRYCDGHDVKICPEKAYCCRLISFQRIRNPFTRLAD